MNANELLNAIRKATDIVEVNMGNRKVKIPIYYNAVALDTYIESYKDKKNTKVAFCKMVEKMVNEHVNLDNNEEVTELTFDELIALKENELIKIGTVIAKQGNYDDIFKNPECDFFDEFYNRIKKENDDANAAAKDFAKRISSNYVSEYTKLVSNFIKKTNLNWATSVSEILKPAINMGEFVKVNQFENINSINKFLNNDMFSGITDQLNKSINMANNIAYHTNFSSNIAKCIKLMNYNNPTAFSERFNDMVKFNSKVEIPNTYSSYINEWFANIKDYLPDDEIDCYDDSTIIRAREVIEDSCNQNERNNCNILSHLASNYESFKEKSPYISKLISIFITFYITTYIFKPICDGVHYAIKNTFEKVKIEYQNFNIKDAQNEIKNILNKSRTIFEIQTGYINGLRYITKDNIYLKISPKMNARNIFKLSMGDIVHINYKTVIKYNDYTDIKIRSKRWLYVEFIDAEENSYSGWINNVYLHKIC